MTSTTQPEDGQIRKLAMLAGLIVGRNGKGGSGTCVKLEDGSVALLTAKHVVIECLRNSGEIAIATPYSEIKFQRPKAIRMDSSQQGDAAILVFNDFPNGRPAVPFEEWTSERQDVTIGMQVFACGFPSTHRIIENERIRPTFVYLKDRVSSIQGDRISSGINETIQDIPDSFRGMSGGGLFSSEGRFLGIVIEESRRLTSSHGELHSLLPSGYSELYKPFAMPSETPTGDYYAERRSLSLELIKPDNSGTQAIVGVLADLYWSQTAPEHPSGRIGRLISLEFIFPGIDTHYPINIESMFSWSDDTEEGRMRAIQEEFKFLLLRIGWLLQDDTGGGELSLEVHPMI